MIPVCSVQSELESLQQVYVAGTAISVLVRGVCACVHTRVWACLCACVCIEACNPTRTATLQRVQVYLAYVLLYQCTCMALYGNNCSNGLWLLSCVVTKFHLLLF